jgi:hypothetical protein
MSGDKKPPYQLNMQGRYMTRCRADDDDYCDWKDCPQLRDNEPKTSGRHCPLDAEDRRAADED